MFNQSESVGYSVYYTQFEKLKEKLPALYRGGSSIFTSFHIGEESGSEYVSGMEKMCSFLHSIGYKITGDVSKRTLSVFGETDIVHFAARMHISVLRIDCGFSVEEIASIAKQMPVCINASTVSIQDAAVISKDAVKVYALHNFYPRPETALDELFFCKKNAEFNQYGIEAAAFIPGDILLRGPIFEGLPTLEKHRGTAPWAAFCDMCETYNVRKIIVGDGIISPQQLEYIDSYCKDGIINIPVDFCKSRTALYGSVFTIRGDSPAWLMRMEESRLYACAGEKINPENCSERKRGCITMDNIGYKRYSGEIQILKKDFPADSRVNVIGSVSEKYLLLLDAASNGSKIRFVRMEPSEC